MKRTNKAIALMLALLMLLSSMFGLTACKDKNNGDGTGDNGGSGNNSGSSTKKESYSISVVTKGGMAMAELPVYIYEYEDGSLGDVIDYAATNANGKATFSLPKDGNYAAKIDVSMPEGYDVKDHYPLVSNNLDITVSSAVIPETSLVGVTYTMGSIIRDFTVTTTESRKFTLSEALKEKKAVLINFWYDGCSWCELEFPLMQKAYEKYSDDLAIIALDPPHATGGQDNLLSISQYKSALGLTFDVAMDNDGLYSAFGVEGYPFSAIVDRYGVIAFIEPGAITSERDFECIFEHFTKDDYEQKLVYSKEDIVPKETPNVTMPSSDEISETFDKNSIDEIQYLPYPENAKDSEKEYSWPFVISDFKGEEVIVPSNAFKEGSYAQMIIEVPLKAGEALAFDWFSSTEMGADILYVIVDGKDIYSISGESEDWKSCFAYVAKEDATYELALIYQKDNSDNVGDDTVYLKNLRKVSVEDINEPTYIFRFAATNPDEYSNYQDYITPVLGSDGYYHVNSANGPLLLANLMSFTRFSADDYVYNMCIGKSYEAALTKYCNYASNSQISGVCPVTEDLKNLLWEIVKDYGDKDNPNDWLKICNYYDSYGTDEELGDPIKGLSTFSAYDVILSTTPVEVDEKGQPLLNTNNFPNAITYDRVIMPRGLYSKFVPTESGTYLISSRAPGEKEGTFIDCEAWLFKKENLDTLDRNDRSPWYTYSNIDRDNVGEDRDMSNVYMLAYLEAGNEYFINIAYGDVYQEGTISFRVERLGGEGVYRFALASPGFFTALLDDQGGMTETVSGGIALELGNDNIWREKRTDGRPGSIIYADFTRPTGIFGQGIADLIEMGAFNLATNENDEYILKIMKSYQAYAFYLDLYLKDLWGSEYNAKSAEYKVSEVLAGTYHGALDENGNPTKSENDKYILELRDSMATNTKYNNHDNLKEFLKDYWGDTYQESFETYKVDEVLAGKYHGSGEDYTAEISKYLDKVIKVGYNAQLGVTIAEGDSRIGCVVVDENLAKLLQVIMDKYTFEGIKNSWAKLCYYHQYFCSATPF